MEKTREHFKKIRDTKGTLHAKMDSIKDRNGMDLTEAEDIKKKQQEYTEELYKSNLNDPNNHDGVINHLEPDIFRVLARHFQDFLRSSFCGQQKNIHDWDLRLQYTWAISFGFFEL